MLAWSRVRTNMVVHAKDDQIVVAVMNPLSVFELFDHSDIRLQVARWRNDLQSILADVRMLSAR